MHTDTAVYQNLPSSFSALSLPKSADSSAALEHVRPIIEEWLGCTFMDEAEDCQRRIAAAEPCLNVKDLQLARTWIWQSFGRDQNTFENMAGLYTILQAPLRMDLGPTAFRYCRSRA